MEYKFTSENFVSEVLQSDIPVFVDFYADWCGPCKRMAPIIAEIAAEYDGKVKVGKINVDENPDEASAYDVMSIPNMAIFKGGQLVDRVIGQVPKNVITEKLNAVL